MAKGYTVSKLRRTLRRFPEELRTDLRAAITDGAAEVKAEIAQRAPVDKGKLRAEVHSQVSRDGLSALIGYSQNRSGFKRRWKRGGFEALWQEFGAKHHAAQPFIQPAFRAKLHGILNRIDAAVNSTIKKAQNWKG